RTERFVTRHDLAPPHPVAPALRATRQLAPPPFMAALSGFSAGRLHRKSGAIPTELRPSASAPVHASAGRTNPKSPAEKKVSNFKTLFLTSLVWNLQSWQA